MAGDVVQQIKERVSIVEVVALYTQLTPAGKNLKGKSPFTNEKTPSFHVSPDRGMFYCFSSNQGGDIFTFVQLMEGVDFKGALKQLAERAGVELVPEDPQKRSERDIFYALLEAATYFYQEQLSTSEESKLYLKKRGLQPDTIARWRIGYAPGPPQAGWRVLSEAMQEKGYAVSQLTKTGLVKGGEAGKAPYDVFRDRIMFPLFDSSGRVVAFSGRLLTKESEAPKYVNSPETELYNKSELLFGYDRAKEGIRKLGFSMIVEGQFDVVMSHQAGYHNTVAVSGTALTAHHVDLLQRLSQKVVLALDSDRAGIAALEKAAHMMLARGMDVKVAHLPAGSDPADIIQENTATFKRLVSESVHVIQFLLSHLRTEVPDQRSYTLRVRERIVPFLIRLPSALEREFFIGVVAEALASTKEAVRAEVDRALQTATSGAESAQPVRAPAPAVPKPAPTTDRVDDLTAFLAVGTTLVDEQFGVAVSEFINQHIAISLQDALAQLPPEKVSELTFTLESTFSDWTVRTQQEALVDRANELAQVMYSHRIAELREQLSLAEAEHDEARLTELLGSIAELQRIKTAAYFEFT